MSRWCWGNGGVDDRRAAVAAGLAAAAGLWLTWPLLRPAVAPARGSTLVVVFDGYHRLDGALAASGYRPLLLITCPLTGQPTDQQRLKARDRPFFTVVEGWDSAHQLTVLAHWLRQPPAALPEIGRVLLVSDSHHLPRLLPAARLALGSQGLRLQGLAADGQWPETSRHPLPGPWPISRDWLRLQLWRATGSTGAFLVPATLQRKQAACG
jgi:hypothetical protein